MAAESLRLFFALWPDAATAAGWQAWVDGLPWPAGARRTTTPHLHLTLHFLGAVDPALLPALQALVPPRIAPIDLHFNRLQDWDGIAVLRPAETPPALAALHAQLGESLQQLGLSPEGRRFRPHVTLARKAPGLAGPADLRWRARCVALAQSRQGYHLLAQSLA